MPVYFDRCSACPTGKFSFEAATWIDGRASPISCIETCPYGGDCESGGAGIVARPGFWGSRVGSGAAFHSCPDEYCCEHAPCENLSSCSGNRRGVLCGECQQGYSAAFGTTACVESSSCGGLVAVLAVLGAAFGAAVYALYLYFSSTSFASEIDCLFYWYQKAAIILSSSNALTSLESAALRAVARFLFYVTQLKISGNTGSPGSGGVCLFAGEDTLAVTAMSMLCPAAIAVAIVAIHLGVHFRSAALEEDVGDYLRPSLLAIGAEGNGSDGVDDISERRAFSHPPKRLAPALVKLFFFAVALLVNVATALLSCVEISGESGSRLYVQASLICFSKRTAWWQMVLVFAVLALFFALLCPVIGEGFPGMRAQSSWAAVLAQRVARSRSIGPLRVIAHEPFRTGATSWGCVMALHRIALAALSAVGAWSGTLRLLAMTSVCLASYHAHQRTQPFENDRMNQQQGTLLLALLALAVLQFPLTDAQTVTYEPADAQRGDPIRNTTNGCLACSCVILCLPAGYAFVLVAMRAWRGHLSSGAPNNSSAP